VALRAALHLGVARPAGSRHSKHQVPPLRRLTPTRGHSRPWSSPRARRPKATLWDRRRTPREASVFERSGSRRPYRRQSTGDAAADHRLRGPAC